MATIIKDPQGRSPYWIAVISTIQNGRPKRVWRSTKIRHTPLGGDKRSDGKPVTKKDLELQAEDIARGITSRTSAFRTSGKSLPTTSDAY